MLGHETAVSVKRASNSGPRYGVSLQECQVCDPAKSEGSLQIRLLHWSRRCLNFVLTRAAAKTTRIKAFTAFVSRTARSSLRRRSDCLKRARDKARLNRKALAQGRLAKQPNFAVHQDWLHCLSMVKTTGQGQKLIPSLAGTLARGTAAGHHRAKAAQQKTHGAVGWAPHLPGHKQASISSTERA